MRRGNLRFTLVAVAALGLAGCVGAEPLPTLPPTPSATPLFASEEEALAAAEEAYRVYQDAVDFSLTHLDDSVLDGVATGDALQAAKEAVARLASEGSRQEGATRVASVAPTDLSPLTEPGLTGDAQIYGCIDLSSVAIVEADGTRSRSEVVLFPMIVTLAITRDALLVAKEEVWDGSNFCA